MNRRPWGELFKNRRICCADSMRHCHKKFSSNFLDVSCPCCITRICVWHRKFTFSLLSFENPKNASVIRKLVLTTTATYICCITRATSDVFIWVFRRIQKHSIRISTNWWPSILDTISDNDRNRFWMISFRKKSFDLTDARLTLSKRNTGDTYIYTYICIYSRTINLSRRLEEEFSQFHTSAHVHIHISSLSFWIYTLLVTPQKPHTYIKTIEL